MPVVYAIRDRLYDTADRYPSRRDYEPNRGREYDPPGRKEYEHPRHKEYERERSWDRAREHSRDRRRERSRDRSEVSSRQSDEQPVSRPVMRLNPCTIAIIALLIFFVLAAIATIALCLTLIKSKCPDVPLAPNTEVLSGKLIGSEKGENLILQCLSGHAYDAQNSRDNIQVNKCQGLWEKPFRVCREISCPDITVPQGVTILTGKTTDNKVKDELVGKCQSGKIFPNGETQRRLTCTANGLWDNELQECQDYQCASVIPPLHGTQKESVNAEGNQQVTVTCDEGFQFEDGTTNMTLTCSGDGTWDGEISLCGDTPIDGNWTEWIQTTYCDNVCSSHAIHFERSCTNPAPAFGGKDCEGSATKEEKCEYDPACITIYATKANKWSSPTEEMYFENVLVDKGGKFADQKTFTAPKEGVYHITITGGKLPNEDITLQIFSNGESLAALYENHEVGVIDTVHYEALVELTEGQMVSFAAPDPSKGMASMSEDGMEILDLTSVTIVCYSALYHPVHAFSVKEEAGEKIPLVNIADVFNIGTSEFVAPVDGIFYFSLTYTSEGEAADFFLNCDGVCPSQTKLALRMKSYAKRQTTASFLFRLSSDDKVWNDVTPLANPVPADAHNILSGFLYSPILSEHVAFFVYDTSDKFCNKTDLGNTNLDPYPYSTVLLNEPDDYNEELHTFKCRLPGLYHFYISATTSGSLAHVNHFQLTKNGIPQASLYMGSGEESYLLSRSLILNLVEGDVVSTRTNMESVMISNFFCQDPLDDGDISTDDGYLGMSFMGMLLQEA